MRIGTSTLKAFGPLALALALPLVAPAQSGADLDRGQYLFTDGYKCYACHGFDAQSGARRLVPLNYTLEGFTALVHNSPFNQMPSFNDVPDADLAAIFAYIRTIPADAPAIDDIPLLRDIEQRKKAALEAKD